MIPVFSSPGEAAGRPEAGESVSAIECGDRDGEGDGQRELFVEDAGGSGKKLTGIKDGDEGQRCSDNALVTQPWRCWWLVTDQRDRLHAFA